MFRRNFLAVMLSGAALLLFHVPNANATFAPGYLKSASVPPLQLAASYDATYRSCRRQVRRAAGIVPGKRMRLPRAYHVFVDRCVANGGIYN